MMSLDKARLFAARGIFWPVPELVLSAGLDLEQTEHISTTTPEKRLAMVQLDMLSEVATFFWNELAGAAKLAEQSSLAEVASTIERSEPLRVVARATGEVLRNLDSPLACVPTEPWADYVTSTALAQLLLLLDANHIEVDEPLSADALHRARIEHLVPVPGMFWDTGQSDPVAGIAGWITQDRLEPDLAVAAIVSTGPMEMRSLRWNALATLAEARLPPFERVIGLRGPFEVIGAMQY